MYYVYEWYIVQTGEIIYVGKGTGRRYRVTKHNKFFNEMIKRFECDSRIVAHFDSEQEAFGYEFARIRELKAINQCVCNVHDGGTGGSTKWWTPEIREIYSKNNVMKSEKQRQRMSVNNPMKNKSVAMRVGKTKHRQVIIGDTEYETFKEAYQAMNVCYDTLRKWCIDGHTSQGVKCGYKDGIIKTRKVYGNQKPSPTKSDNSSGEGSTTNE